MYCMHVWRPIMEASSTIENIMPPVVSKWNEKVNNGMKLQCQNILFYSLLQYLLTILNIANVHLVIDCLIEDYNPSFYTKSLSSDSNSDFKVKVLVQFQSLNLD